VTIKLTANKRLTGRTLVANEFSFALRDGNGNLLQTKTNTSSGSISFDGIDLNAEGTYYYVISEVKGSATDITYDTHQARVTVTVTKDSSGTFTARAAYDSSNSTTFNNTYTGAGSTATAANGSSSGTSRASAGGTAATAATANREDLAKTADPTLFTALPMLATAGAASVVAGVIRRRRRK
jgi:pilin isopeptide linkage protein